MARDYTQLTKRVVYVSKINHNSDLYSNFNASMQDSNAGIHGQRNSNYIYRLDCRANQYLCNLYFSPQPNVLLSRVIFGDPNDFKNTTTDLTFATNMSGQQFDDIKIPTKISRLRTLYSILMDLTVSVNFHHNWKQTIDFDKLTRVLAQNNVSDDDLRKIDTAYRANKLKGAVKQTVKSISMPKAQKLIPKAYKWTNLAKFWLDGFRMLKCELDKKGFTHEDFSHMNFTNKDFRKFEK